MYVLRSSYPGILEQLLVLTLDYKNKGRSSFLDKMLDRFYPKMTLNGLIPTDLRKQHKTRIFFSRPDNSMGRDNSCQAEPKFSFSILPCKPHTRPPAMPKPVALRAIEGVGEQLSSADP